jgi:hypothetical protein
MRGLQAMYGVMIWVQDGLITIPTTLIIRSHDDWFYTPRETYLHEGQRL